MHLHAHTAGPPAFACLRTRLAQEAADSNAASEEPLSKTPAQMPAGPQHIDLPGLSQKDCRLQFYCYSEGTTVATVTFRNEATGEYSFYKLTFAAAPPAMLGTLVLESPVRVKTSQAVMLDNPLPSAVTMAVACDNRQVGSKAAWSGLQFPACSAHVGGRPPSNPCQDQTVLFQPVAVVKSVAQSMQLAGQRGHVRWHLF